MIDDLGVVGKMACESPNQEGRGRLAGLVDQRVHADHDPGSGVDRTNGLHPDSAVVSDKKGAGVLLLLLLLRWRRWRLVRAGTRGRGLVGSGRCRAAVASALSRIRVSEVLLDGLLAGAQQEAQASSRIRGATGTYRRALRFPSEHVRHASHHSSGQTARVRGLAVGATVIVLWCGRFVARVKQVRGQLARKFSSDATHTTRAMVAAAATAPSGAAKPLISWPRKTSRAAVRLSSVAAPAEIVHEVFPRR